jgi:CheY-like chemotaxis protein
VVEDDTQLRETLAECLVLDGHGVYLASDGVEGLDLLRRGANPDAILLDLVMPHMGGEAFLAELRRDPKLREKRVVLMTGARRTPSGALPVEGFLFKPFNLASLREALLRVLGPAPELPAFAFAG